MHTLHFPLYELKDYIAWPYLFHAWGFPANKMNCSEAIQLKEDALRLLEQLSKDGYQAHFRFRLLPACSDGDDLLLGDATQRPLMRPQMASQAFLCSCPACARLMRLRDAQSLSDEDGPRVGSLRTDGSVRLPLLRQQRVPEGKPCLCLSDFVRPIGRGEADAVGLFAATVDAEAVQNDKEDSYGYMLSQTLCDRMAEAAAERGHLEVRRNLWGYAPDEDLPVSELLVGHYQGIRPAVGYPCLPDQSLNFLLADLLDFSSLGITLTESAAMLPHASVSGLMFAHPQARYFEVGPIGEDQLLDYAHRRHKDARLLRRFLQVLDG